MNHLLMGCLVGGMCLSFVVQSADAQVIWEENFNYNTGNLVSQGGWLAYSGEGPITVNDGNLAYPTYPSSSGKLITITSSNTQSAYNDQISETSGNVYVSFLINISDAPTTGAPFFFLDEGDGADIRYAQVYAKKDGANVKFGIRFFGTAGVNYATGNYSFGTVHLIVVLYQFNTSSADDDAIKLWIDPVLSGGVPEADISMIAATELQSDAQSLEGVAVVQSGVAGTIDGMRVGKTWNDAPLPVQLASLSAVALRGVAEIRWSTATEVNNYGFEVERRMIGQTAASTSIWQALGFVHGAGTSTRPRDYSFTDQNISPGRYAYRLKQIDMDGSFRYSFETEVEIGMAPRAFTLSPPYPNPFNPATTVDFSVPDDGAATLKVFNLLGQEVATLFSGEAQAGRMYSVRFDASSLPSGVYLARLMFGNQHRIERMVFAR